MNIKHILALSLTVISANSLAMEISQGKLISHKEWSTGKVKASFTETIDPNNKKALLLKILNQKNSTTTNSNDEIFALTSLDSLSNWYVEKDVIAKGQSSLFIKNMTNIPHTYSITTKICIEKNPSDADCASSEDILTIDPLGYTTVTRLPELKTNITQNDNYFAYIQTIVKRDASNTVYISHDIASPNAE